MILEIWLLLDQRHRLLITVPDTVVIITGRNELNLLALWLRANRARPFDIALGLLLLLHADQLMRGLGGSGDLVVLVVMLCRGGGDWRWWRLQMLPILWVVRIDQVHYFCRWRRLLINPLLLVVFLIVKQLLTDFGASLN